MKKIFIKKRKKFMITSVFFLLMLLPVNMLAACTDPNGCVFSTGVDDIKKTPPKYGQDRDSSYAEHSAFYPLAQLTFTSQTTGNEQSYNVYTSQYGADLANTLGLCAVPCVAASDLGLSGSRDDWANQIANAGEKEGANGKNFDYSDPFSLNKAKEVLKLDGVDISQMSDQEIANKATELAKTNGGFSKSELQFQTVVVDRSTGRSFYCPGSPECSAVKADGFAVNAIADMNKGTAKTDDGGALCANGECPEEPDPDKPTTPNPTDYELNSKTCGVSIPNIPQPVKKSIPQSYSGGGTCGSTAYNVSYSEISVACGKATVLETVRTTAQLPSVQSKVYAGSGFDWGSVSSVTNISTTLYDTSQLDYEMMVSSTRMAAISSAIACNQEQLKKLTDDYNQKHSSCMSTLSSLEDDLSDCEDDDCGYLDDSPCQNCEPTDNSCLNSCEEWISRDCDCSSERTAVSSQRITCNNLTTQYNQQKNALENTIKGLQNDLKLEEGVMADLKSCASQIPSSKSSTSHGTVSLVNEKMTLGKYTQLIDTIRGVHKNSGNPLTLSEMKKLDGNTYLKVNNDFFVPYYIKDGTKGFVSGSIVGGISIPNYSCPINVENNVMCNGSNCKGLNIIYRPISLTNAFPNTTENSKYRPMGSNWNSIYAERYIEQNRNVSDYDIYKMTPLYTITLTPSTIKEIQKYNKSHSFGDFDMQCISGYQCTSNFLWNSEFTKIIDQGNSCASSSGWAAECYYGGVSQ